MNVRFSFVLLCGPTLVCLDVTVAGKFKKKEGNVMQILGKEFVFLAF